MVTIGIPVHGVIFIFQTNLMKLKFVVESFLFHHLLYTNIVNILLHGSVDVTMKIHWFVPCLNKWQFCVCVNWCFTTLYFTYCDKCVVINQSTCLYCNVMWIHLSRLKTTIKTLKTIKSLLEQAKNLKCLEGITRSTAVTWLFGAWLQLTYLLIMNAGVPAKHSRFSASF